VNNTAPTPQCHWSDEFPCQFLGYALVSPIQDYNGKTLCRAHAPHDAKDSTWTINLVATLLQTKQTDFKGMQFPGGIQSNPTTYHFINPLPIDCRHCTFGTWVDLYLGTAADFSNGTFEGNAKIQQATGPLVIRESTFKGPSSIYSAGQATGDFRHSTFQQRLDVSSGFNIFNFDRCVFEAAPRFSGDKLPQQTTFHKAKFERTALKPEDEGSYRNIRNAFHTNRARELEGLFYRYEKICHRKMLPLYSFARWLSCLYDLTARYGQSYERALVTFIILQLVFGFIYEWRSDRLRIPGPIDWTVVAFTLSQVTKPFELLSAKDPGGAIYTAVVGQSVSPSWDMLTLAQSLLSIIVLALLLIAIRWRFRRD
jgi:hypothetical protein